MIKTQLCFLAILNTNWLLYSQVGIGTSTPSSNSILELTSTNKGFLLPQVPLQARNLSLPLSSHIKGTIIYNTQTNGIGPNAVKPGLYYNDGTRWIEMTTDTRKIGDIKYSYQTNDHKGWYLLNGRNISSLNETARQNAITLGHTTTLPNIQNRFVKTLATSENIGATGGGSVVLTRANLPNVNLTGSTNITGSHSHTYTDNTTASGGANGGTNNPISNTGNGNYNTNSAGAHTHTFSFPSGGSGTPITYTPPFLAANIFIYLGN